MKTIFDKATTDELISRIRNLRLESRPAWGKMTVYQMVVHCIKWEEMLLQDTRCHQSLLGRIFGKFGLRDIMKDTALKKNLPTVPSFKINGDGNLTEPIAKWIQLAMRHNEPQLSTEVIHPFFGKLTREQTGIIAYKHFDHHLRQFNS